MLLLLSTANCKVLTQWQGPYTEVVHMDPVNYCLQQASKRKATQLHHILYHMYHSPV